MPAATRLLLCWLLVDACRCALLLRYGAIRYTRRRQAFAAIDVFFSAIRHCYAAADVSALVIEQYVVVISGHRTEE